MTTGYVCSACGTAIPEMSAMTCANCGVDFGKVGPIAAVAPPWSPIEPVPVTAPGPSVGWRLPPEMDPSWARRSWPRRHWRALTMLVVVVLLVAAAGVGIAGVAGVFGNALRAETDIISASDGRITNINVFTNPDGTEFYAYAASGVGAAEGLDLACRVVKPTLDRDGFASAGFEVLDRAGDILATESTPCGEPAPTPSGLNARADRAPGIP